MVPKKHKPRRPGTPDAHDAHDAHDAGGSRGWPWPLGKVASLDLLKLSQEVERNEAARRGMSIEEYREMLRRLDVQLKDHVAAVLEQEVQARLGVDRRKQN